MIAGLDRERFEKVKGDVNAVDNWNITEDTEDVCFFKYENKLDKTLDDENLSKMEVSVVGLTKVELSEVIEHSKETKDV